MPDKKTRPSENWYAVHTNAKSEALAAGRLWQRYPVFLPRRRVTIRHARQERTELRPALPRYLFVRSTREGCGLINRTPGVSTILTVAGEPPKIPDAMFETFRAAFDRDGIAIADQTFDDFRKFSPGQQVKITNGPLDGLMGRVERVDTSGGLRLLIAMFGRFVDTSVVAEWVEAVSNPTSPVPAEPSEKSVAQAR